VLAARRATELAAVGDAARQAGAASVLVVPTDMDDASAVEALVQRAGKAHGGRLDVLFLNHARVDDALISSHADARALEENLRSIFQTNVIGSAQAARAALPLLEAASGHIAVVSSASAKVAAPFHSGAWGGGRKERASLGALELGGSTAASQPSHPPTHRLRHLQVRSARPV